jgi:hypothetical protein
VNVKAKAFEIQQDDSIAPEGFAAIPIADTQLFPSNKNASFNSGTHNHEGGSQDQSSVEQHKRLRLGDMNNSKNKSSDSMSSES